jgi:Zn-dependent M28 family amino/carboxypeptidase
MEEDMARRSLLAFAVSVLTFASACQRSDPEPVAGEPTFSAEEYAAHLTVLSGDEMGGRGIGSPGGDAAATYVAGQFEQIGLLPISEERGHFQDLNIRQVTDQEAVRFSLSVAGRTLDYATIEDVVINSELTEPEASADGELFFVGYGIAAPERDWDDYKGTDVTGKILLMLVNDPDHEKTGFGSEAMTYYGRWTYKQEIARARGAAGLLLIHTDETATYPFSVVQSYWGKGRISLDRDIAGALPIYGWISQPAMDKALAVIGTSVAELKSEADNGGFRPRGLGIDMSVSLKQSTRTLETANVIGFLPGTEKPDETVIYVAHYDHLGIGRPDATGDAIYNGALDNASGVSALLLIAKAYMNLEIKPKRTVVFVASTAEEGGMLGSTYYVSNPVFPLENTAFVVNMDGVNVFGETDDFVLIPTAVSDADEAIRRIGASLGMELGPDPVPGQGMEFRSDHFPFNAKGVVAQMIWFGTRFRGKPVGWGEEKRVEYNVRSYHQPSDDIKDDWDYAGSIQHMTLLYRIGRHYADGAPGATLNADNPYIPAIRMRKEY